jgi:hypothetical protein
MHRQQNINFNSFHITTTSYSKVCYSSTCNQVSKAAFYSLYQTVSVICYRFLIALPIYEWFLIKCSAV